MKVRTLLAGLLFLLGSAGRTAAGEAPVVVATLAPLHSLAAFVMRGAGSPDLLLQPGASPHFYQLRPSEARRLAEAEVILWVGPELENFLVRPLANLAPDAVRVTASRLPGIRLLPAADDARKAPSPEAYDPHLWLDPANARVIGEALAAVLAERDPARADLYRTNAQALAGALAELRRELDSLLAPVRSRPFLVLHDAFRYFETAFGLRGLGAVTVSPERPPGPRRLAEILRRIRREGVVCIFSEPQLRSPLLDRLIADTGVRTATLDPLGVGLAPGPELYFRLLRRNAEAVRACLGN